MKMKILLASLLVSFSSFVMADAASDAIDAAKEGRKAAAAVGFEWKNMEPMIKKAEAAAKEGKTKKAIKIANKVVFRAKAAVKQAEAGKLSKK